MALSKAKKSYALTKLEASFAKSKAVVFLDIQGLKVKDMELLRRECKKDDAECIVAKKTLMTIAMQKSGIDELNARSMEGEMAAVFAYGDEVTPAKSLAAFAKKNTALKLKGGLLMSSPAGSRALDAAAVARFAQLPSKLELLSKLVGSLSSPMRGLVTVTSGVPRSFVQVLKAVSESKA